MWRASVQHNSGTRMPPPQLRRAMAVVGEEEVFDRVLDAPPTPVEVVADQLVDTLLVVALPRRPLRDAEYGELIGHQSSVGNAPDRQWFDHVRQAWRHHTMHAWVV